MCLVILLPSNACHLLLNVLIMCLVRLQSVPFQRLSSPTACPDYVLGHTAICTFPTPVISLLPVLIMCLVILQSVPFQRPSSPTACPDYVLGHTATFQCLSSPTACPDYVLGHTAICTFQRLSSPTACPDDVLGHTAICTFQRHLLLPVLIICLVILLPSNACHLLQHVLIMCLVILQSVPSNVISYCLS